MDIAAIPFFLICQDRAARAVGFLQEWKDWYSYEVCEILFSNYRLAASIRASSSRNLAKFVDRLATIGPLAASLSFHIFPERTRKDLIVKLSRVCKRTSKLDLADSFQFERRYRLQDGFRKAIAIALSLGLSNEAWTISLRTPHPRPSLWSLRDDFYNRHNDVFSFVFGIAVLAAAKNKVVHEKDLLPKELVPFCSRINKIFRGDAFRQKVRTRLPLYVRNEGEEDKSANSQRSLSRDEKQEAERFVDQQLQPLLNLTNAFSHFLAASAKGVDKAFIELLKVWEDARKNRNRYEARKFDNFFRVLGLETTVFALWVRRQDRRPSDPGDTVC